MIKRSGPIRLPHDQRPFWLLVALAIMLLVCVSITAVQAASPLRVAGTLQRDLGALRAQLEGIDPWHAPAAPQAVALTDDFGDGSPAFHRQSMRTIARAAGRRLEQLIAAYRETHDDQRRRLAETLSYGMYDLTLKVDRLVQAEGPAATAALRGEVEAALDRLDRSLALLSTSPTGTLPALDSVPVKR